MDLAKFHSLDILLVAGLPGAGKSHFSKAFFQSEGRKRINRKEIRRSLYEMTNFGEEWSEDYFDEHDESLVKHVERKILEHLLQHDEKVLVDNTSVSPTSRSNYGNLAKQMNKAIGIVFLNPPLQKCLQRNQSRKDSIPDTVISNLSARIDLPDKKEGFQEVLVIVDY